MISLKGKFPSLVDDRNPQNILQIAILKPREGTTMTMSRVYAALIASAVTAMALPTAASARMPRLLHAAASALRHLLSAPGRAARNTAPSRKP